MTRDSTIRARELREQQTKAESLLWSVLRAKQLAGRRFRRQHPIGPYFADFACVVEMLVIEIDGGYHDYTYENDTVRAKYLADLGWKVLRFENSDVIADVDAVTIAIARSLGIEPNFERRSGGASGMVSVKRKQLARSRGTEPKQPSDND